MDFKIALTGNPNVGKTSLFNRLTRSSEHVGNWHGVTVKKVGKKISFGGGGVVIDDLPGLYSLSVYSYEESIARDSVLGGKYDVIVNICEVGNLARNLYLTLQLLELDLPVVLVVNMIDELKKRGQALDVKKLSERLGIPVLSLSAKYRIDTSKLLSTCKEHANAFERGKRKPFGYLDKLDTKRIILEQSKSIEEAGLDPTYAAIKLLENDTFVRQKLNIDDSKAKKMGCSIEQQARVAAVRYEFIEQIMDGIIVNISKPDGEIEEADKGTIQDSVYSGSTKNLSITRKKDDEVDGSGGNLITDFKYAPSKMYDKHASKLDRIVLNKYLALPIFLGIMILIFIITFGLLGKWMSDGLEWLIEKSLYEPITSALNDSGAWQWLTALIGEGIIHGVGGILVFLPQIVLLFFFLAILEDSGYISRVAFMTDGIFRKIGLSGRSAFTMLMGFGCSATAVLTSRGLEDDNMRKKTVMLTPFMSCSARLPVYSAIGGAFFLGFDPLAIFLLYFLGAAVAFVIAGILEKTKRLKSGKLSFIMEMPPYRLPTLERVAQLIWNNSKVFIIRVGTLIFGLNVIVWLLANFSFAGYTAGTDYASFLETFSGLIAPIFSPLGFGNWEAVTALLSGLVAKESVLATIESLGGIDTVFSGENSWLTALCFLTFTLLYVPCFATLGAIGKEIGQKWVFISLVFQTIVAYLVSLIVRLIGLLFILSPAIGFAVVLGVPIILAAVLGIIYSVRHKACKGCGDCPLGSNCGKKRG